jgi:putative ABC transport system substrate-binding protein
LLNFLLVKNIPAGVNRLLLILSLLVFIPGAGKAACAGEVVALLEGRQWPYEMALAGIVETCGCQPEVYYLQEILQVSLFKKKLASLHPSLLVAVGTKSLEYILAHDFGVPVVYAMVLNPWANVRAGALAVTGVSMNVAPKIYWEAMDHIKPAIQKVGLVYNPAETQLLKDHAARLAIEHGQELIAMPAENPKEALHAIKDMAFRIDAFWMLPDQTLIRQEIIDTLVSYSIEQNFVLIGLSSKHVAAGALMAYSFNSKAIGRSAGKKVAAVLKHVPLVDDNSIWAPDTDLVINLKTASKIGVIIDQSLLERAESLVE